MTSNPTTVSFFFQSDQKAIWLLFDYSTDAKNAGCMSRRSFHFASANNPNTTADTSMMSNPTTVSFFFWPRAPVTV